MSSKNYTNMMYPVLLPAISWKTKQTDQEDGSNLRELRDSDVTVIVVDIQSLDWEMIRRAHKNMHLEVLKNPSTSIGLTVDLKDAQFFVFDIDVMEVQFILGLNKYVIEKASPLIEKISPLEDLKVHKMMLKRNAYRVPAPSFKRILEKYESGKQYKMTDLELSFGKHVFCISAYAFGKPWRGVVDASLYPFGPDKPNPISEHFFKLNQ